MENYITTIIISSLAAIVGYFVGTKKYAFEKVYDLKLICIKDLYKQIVELEFILKKYVHFIGAERTKNSIEKKIEELNKIKKIFQEFQHKFWKEEIILDKNTANQINGFLSKYIQITSKLSRSNIEQQQNALKESFESWDRSFELVSSDLVDIKDKLKKEFRRALKIRL